MDSVAHERIHGELVCLPAFTIIYISFTMKSNQMCIGKYTIPMHLMGYGKGTKHPLSLETQCFFPRPLGTLRHRWSDGVLVPAMGGYFHHEF